MDGLGRLLASETNISDLLAYFTEKDPGKWSGLIDVVPAEVIREGGARTPNRADLLLRDGSSAVVGTVEVKLGHYLSEDQKAWYEATFEDDVPLLLTSLDRSDSPDGGGDTRWKQVPLPDLVGRWTTSPDPEVAAFAAAAHRVLSEWSTMINAVAAGVDGGEAEPLARITDPFLARILTRSLRPALLREGAEAAWAGVTSGGGNAILQGWKPLPGRAEGEDVIAEVRWAPNRQTMDFRFGLDITENGRSGRAAAWELAQKMDDVIRVDSFVEYLRNTDPDRATLLSSGKPSGRPSAKGDWSEIVERGIQRGDAQNFNPGFYRDRDTRFEATARVDPSRATGPDVVALLGHALRYLEERG